MLSSAIREYLQANQPRHLAELKEFIRFPSISAQSVHHADCLACAEWLAGQFRTLGLTAEIDLGPAKPIVLAQTEQRPGLPTLLVYGHYDVQPADPMDLWKSPPFEPIEQSGNLLARGASDDKGQVYTWLKAVEAFKAVEGEVPVNLKFFIEGEEEVGSPTLAPFVAGNAQRLACDYVAISDTNFYDENTPSVCYGLRGLVYVEVTLTGPSMDLHSGLYGGAITNPVNALARLIADMHDQEGRVTIPGFYEPVTPLSPQEREAWRKLNFDDAAFMAEMGVDGLTGEAGYSTLERIWGRPTLDCNGIWGGYVGQGPKTVLPAWAKAKISTRLVPNQTPPAVAAGLEKYLHAHRPPGTRVEMAVLSTDEPWLMPPDSPALWAGLEAMSEAFGKPCNLIRGGGSVPITHLFQKHLGVNALMMGYGLPDDRVHSPNEKFRLEHYYRGILAGAALMRNLAKGRK